MKWSALTRSIDKKSGKKKEWRRQESGALVNMATCHYRLRAVKEEDEGEDEEKMREKMKEKMKEKLKDMLRSIKLWSLFNTTYHYRVRVCIFNSSEEF